MQPADHWLREYGGDDRAAALAWLCIPALVLGLVGLFWSLPVPQAFSESSAALNWGTVFVSAAIVYYFLVSIPLAFGSLPFIAAIVIAVGWLDTLAPPLWLSCGALFAGAWTAQRLGERRRGLGRSVYRDLQFLMLGPLWLLARVYRRFGIPY